MGFPDVNKPCESGRDGSVTPLSSPAGLRLAEDAARSAQPFKLSFFKDPDYAILAIITGLPDDPAAADAPNCLAQDGGVTADLLQGCVEEQTEFRAEAADCLSKGQADSLGGNTNP